MKGIGKIFLLDAKRLSTNVVAMVIIMGLSIIPALYAWFNIMSNWDPYGQSATSQMKISVYSCDEGFTLGKSTLSVGDKVIENLEANDTIGWVFTSTEEEALDGVYSGDYYAAIIIPEDFTVKLLSFVGGEPENPSIEYWENSKKNAIATKITSKVRTTIQQTINSSIVSTIAEFSTTAGDVVTGDTATSLTNEFTVELEDTYEDLNTYINILTTLALLSNSGSDLVDSTQSLIPALEALLDSGDESIEGMKDSLKSGAETAETLGEMLDLSLDTVYDGLTELQKQIDAISFDIDYDELREKYDETDMLLESLINVLENYRGLSTEFDQALDDIEEAYIAVGGSFDDFEGDLKEAQKDLKELKAAVSTEIGNCQTAIKSVKNTFDNEIMPKLEATVTKMQNSLTETQQLLANVDANFPTINDALGNYSDVLEESTASVEATRDYVKELQTSLGTLIDGLKALSGDEEYQEVVGLLETDPSIIASFVSSPISLQTEKIYEISTYGSAMAPFYTVLALWVGGLIMVALVHARVKNTKEMEGFNEVQKFFGRYIVFFLIGQAQTLITVLGDLFFVQIQCLHPFRFWLAGAVMSFMFTFFMYALTVSLRNIGQAIAVIVMVIQVAGAGGTFPIEVLPAVYRAIYKFLPFTYAMNAMRECVGGMYKMDYWKDLGVLGIYILISIPIGLLLGKPINFLLNKIDESKEKSGVMM